MNPFPFDPWLHFQSAPLGMQALVIADAVRMLLVLMQTPCCIQLVGIASDPRIQHGIHVYQPTHWPSSSIRTPQCARLRGGAWWRLQHSELMPFVFALAYCFFMYPPPPLPMNGCLVHFAFFILREKHPFPQETQHHKQAIWFTSSPSLPPTHKSQILFQILVTRWLAPFLRLYATSESGGLSASSLAPAESPPMPIASKSQFSSAYKCITLPTE